MIRCERASVRLAFMKYALLDPVGFANEFYRALGDTDARPHDPVPVVESVLCWLTTIAIADRVPPEA